MHLMIRLGLQHIGLASGSTSTICRRSAAHRRVVSAGASRGVDTISCGTDADLAVPRIPRGQLAYQPSYRVVTCPWFSRWTSTRARNCGESTVAIFAFGPSDLPD